MNEPNELLIEAESLADAQHQARSRIPDGFYVLSEEVMADGTPRSDAVTADTIAGAHSAARGAVPPDAEIQEEKEVAAPGKRVLEVKAFGTHAARMLVKRQLSQHETIAAVDLKEKGHQGFIGIGRRPDIYVATIVRPAVVEITYRQRAKIRLALRRLPSESELTGALDDLERLTSEQWRRLDKPIRGEVVALMVMHAAFGFLKEKVSAPFNSILGDAKALLSARDDVGQFPRLELGPPDRAYDVSDMPLVARQFTDAIARIQQLRELVRSGGTPAAGEGLRDSGELFEAVGSGDTAAVCRLVAREPRLTGARGVRGMTPLHMAAIRCQHSVARLLLEAGAAVDAQKDDGWTPLHHASQLGDEALVEILLDHGADPSMKSHRGQTALHAAAYGVTETTTRTLETEWEVTGRENRPKLDPESVVRLLARRGADVHATEPEHGASALHLAVSRGRRGVAHGLLDAGADPNAMSDQWTPLHIAAGRCDEGMVRMLLEKGADIGVRDRQGRLPREVIALASESCEPAVRANLERLLSPSG